MTNSALTKKVYEVVASKLGVAPDRVHDDASFSADLGADSLDMVELLMEMEDQLGISIREDEAAEFVTVRDAIALIEQRLMGVAV